MTRRGDEESEREKAQSFGGDECPSWSTRRDEEEKVRPSTLVLCFGWTDDHDRDSSSHRQTDWTFARREERHADLSPALRALRFGD